MSRAKMFSLVVVFSFAVGSRVLTHGKSRHDPQEAAKNFEIALKASTQQLGWNDPAEPVKVVGPIYFVGTRGLGIWLITTSDGHILLNTGMPESGPLMEASIKKLGFKPEDIKILLTCHAHVDHVGGLSYMKNISGAQVVMMDREVALIQSGGKEDFNYGSISAFRFAPVQVDRVIHDGDSVRLGKVSMKAVLTPGHTRGSTTWVTEVMDGGRSYRVVFPDGTSVNPGYRLVNDPSYPGIADDYRRTFRILAALKPAIWLRPHTETLNLEQRRARVPKDGAQAWVDPEGYKKWVSTQRANFEAAVKKESGS